MRFERSAGKEDQRIEKKRTPSSSRGREKHGVMEVGVRHMDPTSCRLPANTHHVNIQYTFNVDVGYSIFNVSDGWVSFGSNETETIQATGSGVAADGESDGGAS